MGKPRPRFLTGKRLISCFSCRKSDVCAGLIVCSMVWSLWNIMYTHNEANTRGDEQEFMLRAYEPFEKRKEKSSSEFVKVLHAKSTLRAEGDNCPNLFAPSDVFETGAFLATDTTNTTYLYSAYVDPVFGGITVVAITSRPKSRYFCTLWTRNRTNGIAIAHTVPAKVNVISGGHGKQFNSAFFRCSIDLTSSLPFVVSIVSSQCEDTKTFLNVQDSNRRKHVQYNSFTVCVKPFNFDYNKSWQLIEFVELSRILGADHFVFYDYSTSPEVLQVLNDYTKQGLVTVLPWKLPVKVRTWPPTPGSQLHAFGQLTSSNDCLHRFRFSTNFSVFVDLDEFIIPRMEDQFTWHDLFEKSLLKKSSTPSAFVFRNLFVRKDWSTPINPPKKLFKFTENEFSDSEMAIAKEFKLDSLQHVTCESQSLRHGQRSKFIVDPRKVTSVDIHAVSGYLTQVYNVPEADALMFHYRDWETPLGAATGILCDLVPKKYGHALLRRIKPLVGDL